MKRVGVLLCCLLLVQVVIGAPVETKKIQHPKGSAWLRAIQRAYQANDPVCCDRPPYLCACCCLLAGCEC